MDFGSPQCRPRWIFCFYSIRTKKNNADRITHITNHHTTLQSEHVQSSSNCQGNWSFHSNVWMTSGRISRKALMHENERITLSRHCLRFSRYRDCLLVCFVKSDCLLSSFWYYVDCLSHISCKAFYLLETYASYLIDNYQLFTGVSKCFPFKHQLITKFRLLLDLSKFSPKWYLLTWKICKMFISRIESRWLDNHAP